MTAILILVLISLALGAFGLLAFMWSLKSGQYEDLDGAAERVLLDESDRPLPEDPPSRGSDAGGKRERNAS